MALHNHLARKGPREGEKEMLFGIGLIGLWGVTAMGEYGKNGSYYGQRISQEASCIGVFAVVE